MSNFQFLFSEEDKPDLEWDDWALEWIVRQPLEFKWRGVKYVVPVGFRTDLATIPRFFQRMFPKNGKHVYPSIVHDFAYENGMAGMTKEDADLMFFEAMKARRVSWLTRNLFYAAVTVGGHGKWG